jgi:hypothetical protein
MNLIKIIKLAKLKVDAENLPESQEKEEILNLIKTLEGFVK